MQIKFITVYYAHNDLETCRAAAQADLLRQWQDSLDVCSIKPVSKANISFTDWAILDYPEQDKLKAKIDGSLTKHHNRITSKTFWWFLSDRYENFETFYNDLAKTHQLMELTITPEDYNQ